MESKNANTLGTSIGLLVLRLGFGGYLMTHGWGKLMMMVDGKFDQFADPIGIGRAASLVLIVLAEFVCAGMVALGLFTRLATIGPIIGMAVAAFVVHGGDPWTMGGGASKEPAMLYLIAFLTLLFTGAGPLSLDATIACRRAAKAAQSPQK